MKTQSYEVEKQPKFKVGDLVAYDKGVGILLKYSGKWGIWGVLGNNNVGNLRFACDVIAHATASEREQFFEELKSNGYRWDAEQQKLVPMQSTPMASCADAKHTEGKLRYDLLPPEWLESLAKVMTYGADKYPANSWRQGDPTNYRSAMMRHFEAYRRGEHTDPESNLPHLAHAMANLGILITLETQKK